MWIFSELSYLIGWQGLFAAAGACVMLGEFLRKRGKTVTLSDSGEEEETDPRADIEIERFNIWFLPLWLAVTLTGFVNDALSTPRFAQAHKLFDGELSFIPAYVSVAGSVFCVLYGSYKFARAVPFVRRNRGLRPSRVSLDVEDEYFGPFVELETRYDMRLYGEFDGDGRRLNIEISYPPFEKIPKNDRVNVRNAALARSRAFAERAFAEDALFRSKTAEVFVWIRRLLEPDREFDLARVASCLTLSGIGCHFEDSEDPKLLRSEYYSLKYSNATGFGENEIAVLVVGNKVINSSDTRGILTAIEFASLSDDALDKLLDAEDRDGNDLRRLDEADRAAAAGPDPVEEPPKRSKNSYL